MEADFFGARRGDGRLRDLMKDGVKVEAKRGDKLGETKRYPIAG